jgi:maleylpyruvate isomerase
MSAVPPDDLDRRLADVRASTDRLLAALDAFTGDAAALRQPSLLPGWTRAHVLSHLARNADALRRAAEGIQHGGATQMYPGGPESREAEIAAGADRDSAAIRADVAASAAALDATWSAMDGPAWDGIALTRTGPVQTWRTVAMRWREVEIHWVDLDIGYGPADWPATFVAPLLPRLTDPERLAPRLPAGVAVDIEATDSGRRWSVGDGAQRVPVRGPCWALAGWLVGRTAAVRDVLGDPPALAPWA